MPLVELTPLARRLVLAILAALHVGAIIAVGVMIQQIEYPDEFYIALALGVCSGQASVAAVWIALGPHRLLTRASVAMLGVAFSWLPFIGHGLREGNLSMAGVFDGMLLIQFVLVQIPLWYLRVKREKCLRLSGQTPLVEEHPTQFGIGQLLLWTAGAALVFGAARVIVPSEYALVFGGPGIYHMLAVLVVLLVFHTLLPLSIIAAVFARQYAPLWVVLALFAAAVGSWVEPLLFRLLLPNVSPSNDNPFFWVNGPHVAWLLGSLLVLRICGYRLSKDVPLLDGCRQ